MMTTYSYKPLARGNVIRLVRIWQGGWSDPLKGTLLHVPISGKGAMYYEALSYVWGDAHEMEEVAVVDEGGTICVTTNCAAAIRRLRYAGQERLVWIDAICINQNDLEERNSQVRLMGDIYQSANHVLIYLGEAADNSNLAMSCIADVNSVIGNAEQVATSALLSRPWFNRVWVIQEVARARFAVVICGTRHASWESFTIWSKRQGSLPASTAPPAASSTRTNFLDSNSNLRIPRHIAMLKESRRLAGIDNTTEEEKRTALTTSIALRHKSIPGILSYGSNFSPVQGDMLQQLHQTRNCNATDIKDKAFAIFGLVPKHSKLEAILDYRNSADVVYFEVAKYIIEETKSLKVLCATQTSTMFLPSWVPDWSEKRLFVSFGIGDTYTELYNAGGMPAYCQVLDTHSELVATGLRMGTICDVGNVFDLEYGWRTNIFKQWEDTASKSLGSGFSSRVLAETICAESPRIVDDPSYKSWKAMKWCEIDGTWFYLPCNHYEEKPDLQFLRVINGRKLLVTENGFLGLAPAHAEEGDVVCILLGAPVPFILRESDGDFMFVGECYVHGVMNGQGLTHLKEELRDMGHIMPINALGVCSAPLEEFRIGQFVRYTRG